MGFTDLLGPRIKPNSLAEAMQTKGFAFWDNAFGEETSAHIRQEIVDMYDHGLLKPSLNRLSARGPDGAITGHEVAKHDVFELDIKKHGELSVPEALHMAPVIRSLYDTEWQGLVDMFNAAFPALGLDGLDTIKVQYNAGNGGGFPMHVDTKTTHSRRQLTVILYLNPGWEPEHGGELRVYPMPYASADIAPKFDRIAVFCSHQMLHRVRPSFAPRVCLSLWFSGSDVAFPSRPVADDETAKMLSFIYQPKNRHIVSKIVYAKEWADSVRESFGDNAAVDASLALHWDEVKALEKAMNPALLQLLQSFLPLENPFADAEGAPGPDVAGNGNGALDESEEEDEMSGLEAL